MARKDERSSRQSSIRDRARQRAEDNKFSGGASYLNLPDGVEFFKAKKGTNELDIVPYEVSADRIVPISLTKDMKLAKGDLNDRRTIFVHRKIGVDEKAYLCPRTIKKPCPICEERARLQRDASADEDLIKDLKPQVKELYNVIDLSEKGGAVKLFEFSYANFGKKLDEEIREGREDWAGYADLEAGYTLRVRFTEETFAGNKYLEASRFDFEERAAYKDSILDDVVDLDACLVVLPYEQLERIFLQLDGVEDEPEGRKEERASGGGRNRRDRDEKSDDQDEPPFDGGSRRGGRSEESEPPSRPRSGRYAESTDREERGGRRGRQEEEPPPREERGGRGSRTSRDDVKEDAPAERKGRGKKEEPPAHEDAGEDQCPYGHEWGKSCNKEADCNTCDQWDACQDEADRLKKKR